MNIKPIVFAISGICAASFTSFTAVADESSMKDWWGVPTLYQSDDVSIALTGRLHGDLIWVDEDSYDEDTWRRFRFGGKAVIDQLTIHVEADFDLNDDADYGNLTDAYIGWKFANGTKVKLLKQSVGFTLDGATSSKKLYTAERNNLTNNLWFTNEYFTGASVAGKINPQLTYKLGLYGNDDSDEFSDFDAGLFSLASLTFKHQPTQYFDNANHTLSYVFNDEDDDAGTRDFKHVIGLASKFKKGDWKLWTDLSYGNGFDGQGDIWGLVVMPIYQLNDKLDLVTRYTYITGNADNSVRLNRWEGRAVTADNNRGNEYNEFYAGANYYINGQKLKLQAGVQYSDMQDDADDGGNFGAWSAVTSIRMYW